MPAEFMIADDLPHARVASRPEHVMRWIETTPHTLGDDGSEFFVFLNGTEPGVVLHVPRELWDACHVRRTRVDEHDDRTFRWDHAMADRADDGFLLPPAERSKFYSRAVPFDPEYHDVFSPQGELVEGGVDYRTACDLLEEFNSGDMTLDDYKESQRTLTGADA